MGGGCAKEKALIKENTELNVLISQLKRELGAAEVLLAGNESIFEQFLATQDQHLAIVNTLREDQKVFLAEITDLKKSLDECEIKYDVEITAATNAVKKIQLEKDGLVILNNNVNTQLAKVIKDHDTLIASKEKLIADLQASITSLNAGSGNSNTTIQNLNTTITNLTSEKKKLELEIATLKSQNADLVTQNQVLTNEIKVLNTTIGTLQANISELRASLNTVNKELSAALTAEMACSMSLASVSNNDLQIKVSFINTIATTNGYPQNILSLLTIKKDLGTQYSRSLLFGGICRMMSKMKLGFEADFTNEDFNTQLANPLTTNEQVNLFINTIWNVLYKFNLETAILK